MEVLGLRQSHSQMDQHSGTRKMAEHWGWKMDQDQREDCSLLSLFQELGENHPFDAEDKENALVAFFPFSFLCASDYIPF